MFPAIPRGRFSGAPRAFYRGRSTGSKPSPSISVSAGPRSCTVSVTLSDRETIRLVLKGPGDPVGQSDRVGGIRGVRMAPSSPFYRESITTPKERS